jgi:DNA invertase Pin-like site-specific DNA recombinase
MTRVIGYVRVSTAEQGESGAGLDAQVAKILATADAREWDVVEIREEVASGKSMEKRPVLARCIDDIEAGKADALVAAKLDRLSRSTLDFTTLVDRARAGGWKIAVLDLDLDMTTPIGEFVATMMAALAQFERKLIGERTKAALAARRAQGVRLGRPPTGSVAAGLAGQIKAARDQGYSFRKIAAILNEEGIPAPNGGEWYYSAVRRVHDGSIAVA